MWREFRLLGAAIVAVHLTALAGVRVSVRAMCTRQPDRDDWRKFERDDRWGDDGSRIATTQRSIAMFWLRAAKNK